MLSSPSTSLYNVSSDSASNNNLSEGDIMQADQLQSASSEGDFILEPENYDINPINPEGDSLHNINVPEEDSSKIHLSEEVQHNNDSTTPRRSRIGSQCTLS